MVGCKIKDLFGELGVIEKLREAREQYSNEIDGLMMFEEEKEETG